MSKAYPASVFNLNRQVKDEVTTLSRKDIKSLTQTYTGNTSLEAILIVTITFAAACFSSAMCSSLTVASICVIARWEDLELLLYNRSFTKKLMWFAYPINNALGCLARRNRWSECITWRKATGSVLPNTAIYWEWDLPINRNKICQQCLVEFALPDTSSICFTCLRRTGSLLYVYIFLTANLLFIFTFKWFLTSMHTRPEHRVTQLSSFIADACSTAPWFMSCSNAINSNSFLCCSTTQGIFLLLFPFSFSFSFSLFLSFLISDLLRRGTSSLPA